MSESRLEKPDRPWMMRTYAGHSTAKASNELYRTNLAKGQTGLSTAFDLPTLMGLDSDHPRAAGEVGRLGVAVDTLDDMLVLFDGIDLESTSVSMTINAPAIVLMAPLMFPIAKKLGINDVHYAMVVVTAMNIGLMTPPIGIGFYIACKIGNVPPDEAMSSVWPYLLALLLGLILIAAVPAISTVLL